MVVVWTRRLCVRTALPFGPPRSGLVPRSKTVELNSATDNPLIDASISQPRVLYGGNFQAKAITSAVEKIRQGAQS